MLQGLESLIPLLVRHHLGQQFDNLLNRFNHAVHYGWLVLFLDGRHKVCPEVCEHMGAEFGACTGHLLLSSEASRAQKGLQAVDGSHADVLPAEELEHRHHHLCHILHPPEETLLQLVGIATEHVAGGGLLLKGRDADLQALVAELKRCHIIVLLILLILVRDLKVVLLTGSLDQGRHHGIHVRQELLPKALAQACPGLQGVGEGGVVGVLLPLGDHGHHALGVLTALVTAHRHPHQADALETLGPEHGPVLGVDHDVKQKRHDFCVVFHKVLLGTVGQRRQSREGALLDGLGAVVQLRDEGGDEGVQVLRYELAVTVVGEVHHCSTGVALNARVGGVLHHEHQGGEDAAVLLLLDIRPEISAHLPDGLAGRPADAGVRVLDALQARVHQPLDLLEHDFAAALSNLSQADERRVAVAPVLGVVVKEGVHHSGALGVVQYGCTAQSDGNAVQALLPKLAQLPLSLVGVLLLGHIPLGIILDIKQIVHEAHEEAVVELRELAHHARRLLPSLAQGDNKLAGQLAGGLLQALSLCNGHHGVQHLSQAVAHKLGVHLRDLYEGLNGLLGILLLPLLDRRLDSLEHGRDQREKLVPVLLRLEFLHENASGGQGCSADVKRVGFRHAGLEDGVHCLEVLRQHRLHVGGDLGKHVEGALHEAGVAALHTVEHKGQKLRPAILLLVHHVNGKVTHDVANLAMERAIIFLGEQVK
mmetsp:Transcript_24309/g.67588  ORF Transcript_24309/g.67588 Transcript_24309/m.67588 type:complete len:706 (-) Transcript_24309:4-2121(-)